MVSFVSFAACCIAELRRYDYVSLIIHVCVAEAERYQAHFEVQCDYVLVANTRAHAIKDSSTMSRLQSLYRCTYYAALPVESALTTALCSSVFIPFGFLFKNGSLYCSSSLGIVMLFDKLEFNNI